MSWLCDLCRQPHEQFAMKAAWVLTFYEQPADQRQQTTQQTCWQCHVKKDAANLLTWKQKRNIDMKLPISHASLHSAGFPTFARRDSFPLPFPDIEVPDLFCKMHIHTLVWCQLWLQSIPLDLPLWFQDTWRTLPSGAWYKLWCKLLLPFGPSLRTFCSGYHDTAEVYISSFCITAVWNASSLVVVQGATPCRWRQEDARCHLHWQREKNRTDNLAEKNLN